MRRRSLLTAALFGAVSSVFAQSSLSGKVINAATREPVAGANVRIDHSLARCTTNGKGEFRFTGLSDEPHTLSLTHVSYRPQKFASDGKQEHVTIVMEESYINMGQVVVTGTGTHNRATHSPVPIQVITDKEIERAHATSLEEALTKLTGSVTSMTNGMGTTISLNGIHDEYILVLENGKRLTGDDRFNRINIANVKRIEIQNGASSALYGSDAIAGVINIITDDTKNKVNMSNTTHYTSKGRFTEGLNVDFNAGKFSSYTSYQRKEADNWQVNTYDEEGYKTGRPISSGFLSDNISQRFDFHANDRLSLYARGNFYNYETRRPQTATYFKAGKKKDEAGNPIYEETQAYTYDLLHESFNYGAGGKYIINPSAYIEADFLADHYKSSYDYFLKSGSNEKGDKSMRERTHYYNATVKGIFRLNKWNKLSAGVEYVNENFKSETDNIGFENIYTLSAFAQDEMHIVKDLQAVLGVRYIYNENFGSYATPNVALMYKPGNFNFRFSYSTGFRTPTLHDLYATDEAKTSSRCTVANPGLKPEKSNFFSLNAEYTCSRFTVSVTGFYNQIRDMIDYRVLSDEEIHNMGLDEKHETFSTIRQRDNVNRATVRGVNARTNIYIAGGVSVGGSYTYTDTEAETETYDTKTKTTVTETSPVDKSMKHVGNAYANWTKEWKNYTLNINLNGHLQSQRYSSTYGYAPGYGQWDLHTRHTVKLDAVILEPGIGIQNIFNKRDTRPWNSNYSTIDPGRAVYVSMAVRFRK